MEPREQGDWICSNLAEKRAAQRNVDPRLFPVIQRYGRKIYVGGDLHIFLSEKMVPEGLVTEASLRRIRNTMVVVAPDGTVKTVWKDARALKRLRQRRLRRWHPSHDGQRRPKIWARRWSQ